MCDANRAQAQLKEMVRKDVCIGCGLHSIEDEEMAFDALVNECLAEGEHEPTR